MWVDLSQPLFAEMPSGPARGVPRFSSDTLWRHDADASCEIRITRVAMSAHTGTHVDAARHFYRHGRSIDEYPVHAFVGRGVVLDVPRDGVTAVTADDLAQAEPRIEEGDIVFLRFGYGERFAAEAYHAHPHLRADAAEYLVARAARLVGVDTLTPELPHGYRDDDFDFPVHRCLLYADIPIVENLGPGLKEVVGQRLTLGAVPLRIVGADGAPATAFALVEGLRA